MRPGMKTTVSVVSALAISLVTMARAEDAARNESLERNLRTINHHFGKDVSPEENAVVLIHKAFGPHPEKSVSIPKRFYKELGIRVPPEEGDYFEPFAYAEGPAQKQFDKALDEPWTRKACPLIVKWLDDNEKPVDVMIEASHRPKWYAPIVPPLDENGQFQGLFMTLLPATQQIRSVARYFMARAHLAMAERRFEDAWDDVLNCHRLGRMQAKGPTLIDYLVGVAMVNMANDMHVRLVQLAEPDFEKLVVMRQQYRSLPKFPHPAEQIDITERVMLLDMYDMLEQGRYGILESLGSVSIPPAGKVALSLVDWNVARFHGMQAYDDLKKLLEIQEPMVRSQRIGEFNDALKAKGTVNLQSIFNGFLKQGGDVGGTFDNVIADALVQLFLPAMGAVDSASARAFARLQNIETYFALELYRQQNGNYPESLRELVPGLLPTAPIDPFSSKAVVYRRQADGFLLYSLGSNGKDDQGRTFGEGTADDLRIRVKSRG